MSDRAFAVSIIVAAEHPGGELQNCLTALAQQRAPVSVEIVVADASGGEAARRYSGSFPAVRFVAVAGAEVPRLWSEGVAQARGHIVALTIAECVPSPSWIKRIVEAHKAEWPAIGGAIDIAPNTGVVDWAVYFCRYSRYMPPVAAEFLDDLAGDNCSYKRGSLDALELVSTDGFWESLVHQQMRQRGDKLFLNPSVVVFFAGSFRGAAFLKRRFAHGWYFAANQAVQKSRAERALRAFAFPAVAMVMLARIVRRILGKRRNRARLVAALPILLSFLLAWCLGEAVGYWTGMPQAGAAGALQKTKEASSIG